MTEAEDDAILESMLVPQSMRMRLEERLEAFDEYDREVADMITPNMPAEEKASLENRGRMMRAQRNLSMNALTLLSVLEKGTLSPEKHTSVEARYTGLLQEMKLSVSTDSLTK